MLLSDALSRFARFVGVARDDAEPMLKSERAAKAPLSRRELLGAGAALATAAAFSFARPQQHLATYTWESVFDQRRPHPDDRFLALFSGEPGESGEREVNYPGYARQKLVRDEDHWEVRAGAIKNKVDVLFPQCTGGRTRITHYGLVDGDGRPLLYSAIDGHEAEGIELAAGDLPLALKGQLTFTIS